MADNQKQSLIGQAKPEADKADKADVQRLPKILSALFYAFASFMIMVVNKLVLTGHHFPSFQVLGIGQMLATIVVLQLGKVFKIVDFPSFNLASIRAIMPLPLFYVGNMVFGLGGTQALSLPMLTVLRRFSFVMTMGAEFYLLGVRPPFKIKLSVGLMILGATIAALNDLAFNLEGYAYILINDVCTAGTGVFTKKKLNSNDLGKYGLMYYNALLMIGPTIVVSYFTGDLEKAYNFPGWKDNWTFCLLFASSCVFGFILMYATLLCTQKNSALTTSVIGALKNIAITYIGMVFGGDYIFSWLNFIGVSISAIASLFYTKVVFSNKKAPASQLKPKGLVVSRV